MPPRTALIVTLVLLLLACGGGEAATTPIPRLTASPASTPTPAPPTPTLAPVARYEQVARGAARPLDTRSALGLPAGAWAVTIPLPNEVQVTYPMTAGNDNAQTVRQGQRQIAAIVKALFDGAPELTRVNVIGTLPLNESEAPAISVALTRAEYQGWSGVGAELPGMQVSGRLD